VSALPYAAKTAARKAASAKSSTTRPSAKNLKGKKGRTAAKRKPTGPSYQTHPTEDRYKEIQQALADKGYFKGEVNGKWGDDSVEALKRFQADKQIVNDGKISSLALIQLGLGPRHDGASYSGSAAATPPPPVPAVKEEPIAVPVSQ
jgi:peptidoglycan hydrolase-like protein with peptidoglycan-binding domain